MTLYQTSNKKENEKLILAKRAVIDNAQGNLRLSLDEVKIFDFSPTTVEQIDFEQMHINSKPKTAIGSIQTVLEYWNGGGGPIFVTFNRDGTWVGFWSPGDINFRYKESGEYDVCEPGYYFDSIAGSYTEIVFYA